MQIWIVALVLITSFFGTSSTFATEDQNHIRFELHPIDYHDGPNCYNSALVRKGYISELTYTDPIEFKYFLEKFCRASTTSEKYGDILTLSENGTFIHAAFALGSGNIFEKTSSWGKFSEMPIGLYGYTPSDQETKERLLSSQYLVKPKVDSNWFNGRETNGTVVKESVYSCEDSTDINDQLNAMKQLPGIKKIIELNKKLESLLFQSNFDATAREKLSNDVLNIVKEISQSQQQGEKQLFVFVKSYSLFGQLWRLNQYKITLPAVDDALAKLKLTLISMQSQLPNQYLSYRRDDLQ